MARLLLDMLPPELAGIGSPEERATEYLDYRQSFVTWERPERVAECQALEAPQMSRETRAACLRDYTVCVPFSSDPFPPCLLLQPSQSMVTSIHDLIVEPMTTDWLVPNTGAPASTSRPALPFLCVHDETESDRLTRELARRRQLFVPELILRLLTEGTRVGRRQAL